MKRWLIYLLVITSSSAQQYRHGNGTESLATGFSSGPLPPLKALGPVRNGYRDTSYGFRIDASCGNSYSPDTPQRINKLLYASLSEGLQCLNKLGSAAAQRNASKIQSLLAMHPRLLCSELNFAWSSNALAHAPLPYQSGYPMLSLNPRKISDIVSSDFKTTAFHELFHACGYEHGKNIEFAYGCESCCFPSADASDDLIDAGCRICRGQYSGPSDSAYLKDLIELSQETERPLAEPALLTALKRSPQDRRLYFLYAQSVDFDDNTPYAIALRNELAKRYSPTPTEQALLQPSLIPIMQKHVHARALLPAYTLLVKARFSLLQSNFAAARENLQNLSRLSIPSTLESSDTQAQYYQASRSELLRLKRQLERDLSGQP